MSAPSLLRALIAPLVVTALWLTASLDTQAGDEQPRSTKARAMLAVLEADHRAGQPWVELNRDFRLPESNGLDQIRLLEALLPSARQVRDELEQLVARMEAIAVDPRKTSVLFQGLYARHLDAWRSKAEAWDAWADALARALAEARTGEIDTRKLEAAQSLIQEQEAASERAIASTYDVVILAAKEAGVDTRSFEVPDEDAESERPAVSSAPSAAATSGIPDASIEAIYLKRTTTLGKDDVRTTELTPFLFLEDGSFYRNVRSAPADIDLERLRRDQPAFRGRWTRQSDRIVLQSENGKRDQIAIGADGRVKTDQSRDWYSTVPAIDGEPLEGSFSQTSGRAGGVTTFDEIVFSKDGSYARDGSDEGSYRIDGFTLELRSETGRTERAQFFFGVDSKGKPDRGAIGIDGQLYTRDKD